MTRLHLEAASSSARGAQPTGSIRGKLALCEVHGKPHALHSDEQLARAAAAEIGGVLLRVELQDDGAVVLAEMPAAA